VLGGFFWILFNVVFGIINGIAEATSGPTLPSYYTGLVDITGAAMYFGIPAGIMGEIVRWLRGRKHAQSPQQTIANPVQFCPQCVKQTRANLVYCEHCGTRLT
jgi:hypothetical protein